MSTYDPRRAWDELCRLAQGDQQAMPEPLALPREARDVAPFIERLERDPQAREQARRAVVDMVHLVFAAEMRCGDELAELHHRLGERVLDTERLRVLLHVVGHWIGHVVAVHDGEDAAWREWTTPPKARSSGDGTRAAILRLLRAQPPRADAEIVRVVVEACGITPRAARLALGQFRAVEAIRRRALPPEPCDFPDLSDDRASSEGS
jgi:hypothetical protein